jgi:FixJ family two-component response regulator
MPTELAKTKCIVVVDDDRRVRESLESVLESAGYEALLFASGEEFLRSSALDEASCVITDIRMPGVDGIEVQRRVTVVRPQLPVMFITAHRNDSDVRRRALQGGAVAFLYKPFDGEDLLRAIRRALNESRSDRDTQD